MNLLIVDDEISSIRVIQRILDAEALGITGVCTALSAQEAREQIRAQQIDILLCDIEMPRESGLDLLEWINREGLEIVCVYMTCYAEFSYAQRAMHLGGLAYLLKPIVPEELNQALRNAADRIRERRRLVSAHTAFSEDTSNRVRQFWLDLFYDEIPSDRESIRQYMEQHSIPCSADWYYSGCLVVVRNWGHDIDQSHRNNRYAVHQLVQKVFPDIVAQNSEFCTVFPFGQHGQMCLCGGNQPEMLRIICRKFAEEYLKAERGQLPVTSVCYLSLPVPAEQVAEEMECLMQLDNSQLKNHGICVHTDIPSGEEHIPNLDRLFEQWAILLENDKFSKAAASIVSFLQEQTGNPSFTKKKFRYFLSHYAGMLRGYAVRSRFPLNRLTADPSDAAVFERSDQGPEHMEAWVIRSLQLLEQNLSEFDDPVLATKYFIDLHLSEEIDLPQIAENVHLNQDYLTRIFRRETGMSVKGYIVNRRMEKAGELLVSSRLPIAEVAYQVGYYNYTSFNRIFKKTFGISPQSYRKKSEES